MTGNTQQYRRYSHYINAEGCTAKSSPGIELIPGLQQVHAYISFLETYSKLTNTDTMRHWISKQHDGAIPTQIKLSLRVYVSFLHHLIECLPTFVSKVFAIQTTSDKDRSAFVKLMDEMLIECFGKAGSVPTNKNKWLCHMILADMEEIFDSPFGDVTPLSVPSGESSSNGYHVIRKTRDRNYSWVKCLMDVEKHAYMLLHDKQCHILGYKRCHNKLINVVNGRAFNSTDAEHFLCKFWVMIKYTFSHNRQSIRPIMANSYTHPHPGIGPESTSYSSTLLREIHSSFLNMVKSYDHIPPLPDVCMCPGEKQQFAVDVKNEKNSGETGKLIAEI